MKYGGEGGNSGLGLPLESDMGEFPNKVGDTSAQILLDTEEALQTTPERLS